jgi:hypothetical protein
MSIAKFRNFLERLGFWIYAKEFADFRQPFLDNTHDRAVELRSRTASGQEVVDCQRTQENRRYFR